MLADTEGSLIGLKPLADKLSVSRRTVHRIIERGELRTLKIGRRRLVRLAELRRWLDGRETRPLSDPNGGKIV
jgi:excisionase family DNA binding protein